MEDITEAYYVQAEKVCKNFVKILGDSRDLHVQSDT